MSQAKLRTQRANLVFKELAQWLKQLQIHLLRKPSYIVVALYQRRGIAVYRNALNYVGIKRTLSKESYISYTFNGLVKNFDESLSYNLALAFGVCNTL